MNACTNERDTEGVLVAKKDFNAPKHEDLDVPNLEVIKAMQSLTSKGLVKTQFSWQYYYYVLTPEGVDYLREWCVLLGWWGFARCAHAGFVGCTSPTRSSLPHTNVRLVPRARLVFAPALARAVPRVHLAATRKVTGGRRVAHLATTGHPLLVLVGVDLECESCTLVITTDLTSWSLQTLVFHHLEKRLYEHVACLVYAICYQFASSAHAIAGACRGLSMYITIYQNNRQRSGSLPSLVLLRMSLVALQ